ncbi:BTB/POZ domain-containing protein 6-B isoform X2 [Vespa velutina]|uniref:BTB/POZ domain-containing protein 6-B isoform X2 n=1 Tax=Vespa velutina TaxID=202808 RepID=UPI001FB45EA5|nr:BTB/POZ domain-containing protein 6-B isoform X2 [Vespa velutina]
MGSHVSIRDMRLLVGFVGFFKMAVDDTRCIGHTETEKTWENIREVFLRNRISLKVTAIRLSSKNMSEVLPLIVSDETTSDIDPRNMVNLEVGLPGDTWWYRVERERLAKKSECFRAMLTGPMAPERTDPPPLLTIKHIEKRAFDHFFRYLNDEPIIFQSVSTARATLDVAHQYICLDLARFAINYLEENLDSSTVLEIYENLHLYANSLSPSTSQDNDTEESSNRPSAPPASDDDEGSEIAAACTELLFRCLNVIDADPSTVLLQERFEELNVKEVKEIACRDTLRLPNEAILFAALDRWAASNCRKRGVEPTSSNKRASLSDEIWYSVRYLLMTDREFIDGPMAHGILTSEESAFIFAKILGHPGKEEINISMSNPLWRLTNTPRIGTITYYSQGCSMLKSGKKERQDNRKNRRKECAGQACSRICTCFVRVLACVFE